MSRPHKNRHPVSAEQLLNRAYGKLSGDPVAVGNSHHHGSPAFQGADGVSKADAYRASTQGDEAVFRKMAKDINSNGRNRQWLISTRTWQMTPGKKPRPIDIPSETKRLKAEILRDHIQGLADAAGAVLPTVVGFRSRADFPDFADRGEAFTIQDTYACTVRSLLEEHGPWVVVLDLADAFGNLPHAAIQQVLKKLGMNHGERRDAVETVRVRALLRNGKVLKPRGYGIEQGNPASPLTFNLVVSHILDHLQQKGLEGASYGDDMVLVAPTEKAAHEAFQEFLNVTSALGFKNVRLLGVEGKATRILNSSEGPAELIKTFLVSPYSIGLTQAKAAALVAMVPKGGCSLRKLKKLNPWKSVSKAFLRTLLPGTPEVGDAFSDRVPLMGEPDAVAVRDPVVMDSNHIELSETADGDVGHLRTGVQDPTFFPVDEPYRRDAQAELISSGDMSPWVESLYMGEVDPLMDVSSLPVQAGRSLEFLLRTGWSSTKLPGHTGHGNMDKAKEANSGTVSVHGDAHGTSVAAGNYCGGRCGHVPPPQVTVLTAGDAQELKDGKKLRAGDKYHKKAILDVRGLEETVGARRLHHAVHQIARAGSFHGRVFLLVNPGEAWVWDETLWDGFGGIQRFPRPDGMVISFRRVPRCPTGKPRVESKPAPKADLVVTSVHRSPSNCRAWMVRGLLHNKPFKDFGMASTPNHSIGMLEALAVVFARYQPEIVTFKSSISLQQHLAGAERPRQVGLAEAVGGLSRWKWARNGAWLVGAKHMPNDEPALSQAFATKSTM